MNRLKDPDDKRFHKKIRMPDIFEKDASHINFELDAKRKSQIL